MSKQSRAASGTHKTRRAFPKLLGAGLQLAVMGGVLILLPALIGNPVFARALAPLGTVGWLVLLFGAVLAGVGYKLSGAGRTKAVGAKPSIPSGASPLAAMVSTLSTTAPAAAVSAPPRPERWSSTVFDQIEWRRFEAVVERLFQQAGFETKSQSHGADQGVDVWLHSRHQPGGPVSLVQCKHWQGRRVGVDKVRELRGVMAAHGVARGQFATTSTFTPEAMVFARDNGINLLDVDGLLALIARRTPDEQAELMSVALEGEYWRPTCVNCGTKMVDRQPRKGGVAFWGCSGFPKCRTTLPMRRA